SSNRKETNEINKPRTKQMNIDFNPVILKYFCTFLLSLIRFSLYTFMLNLLFDNFCSVIINHRPIRPISRDRTILVKGKNINKKNYLTKIKHAHIVLKSFLKCEFFL